jgi:hypothetical protein
MNGHIFLIIFQKVFRCGIKIMM